MIRAALVLLALLICTSAHAQSTVTAIGPITPNDCVSWFSTTQIKDAGMICGSGGGGTPGGLNGQVQYNNAGTFGGLTNAQLTALITQITPSQCPNATSSTTGCVQPDNSTITISAGVITATTPSSAPNSQLFSNPGTVTTLTLTNTPLPTNINQVSIMFDGLVQARNTWTLNTGTHIITFNAAIPANTQIVEVDWFAPTIVGTGVTSLTTPNNTLNLSASTGPVTADINLAHANAWTGDQYFGSGRPWCDVRAAGAVGNGVTDDTAAIQSCISTVAALGGGIVYFPPGGRYCTFTGISTASFATNRFTFLGASRDASQLDVCNHNVTTLKLVSIGGRIENMSIYGYNSPSASTPALDLSDSRCQKCLLDHVFIQWGAPSVITNADGITFFDVKIFESYSDFVQTGGGLHIFSSQFDQNNLPAGCNFPGPRSLNLTAWQAGHPNSTCDFVTIASGTWLLICTSSGTTGGSEPAPQIYGNTINDGSAHWQLVGAGGPHGNGVNISGTNVTISTTDISGMFEYGVVISAGAANITISDQVTFGFNLAANIQANSGDFLTIHDSLIVDCLQTTCSNIGIANTYTGDVQISNNIISGGAAGIDIGGGPIGIQITNNTIAGNVTGINGESGAGNIHIMNNTFFSEQWGSNSNKDVNIASGGNSVTAIGNGCSSTNGIVSGTAVGSTFIQYNTSC